MLSNMESTPRRPTAAEAAAALRDAEASRAGLAHAVATPSGFFTSMSVAIAVQIAATAAAFGVGAPWLVVAGVAVFGVVAGVQLARFRRRNGVWLGGFAGRVVLGTGTAASLSYALALAAAIWAAYGDRSALVALSSVAGGAAYALAGRRWMRAYRDEPDVHGRGESVAWLALLAVVAVAGLVLLLLDA